MIRKEDNLTAWTVLAVTGTAQAFSGLGASLPMIRAEAQDSAGCERMRAGYRPAAALAFGAAGALSYLSGSWVPLLASVATGYAFMAVSESAMPINLRREPVITLLGGRSLTSDVADLGLTRPYQNAPSPALDAAPRYAPPKNVGGGTSIQFAGSGNMQVF